MEAYYPPDVQVAVTNWRVFAGEGDIDAACRWAREAERLLRENGIPIPQELVDFVASRCQVA